MTTTEHLHTSERAARAERRELINTGVRVSLIAHDPSRDRYVFDSYTAPISAARAAAKRKA
jgi:hypothetical protein